MVASRVTNEFRQQANPTGGQGLLMTRLMPPPQQARLLRRQRVNTLLANAIDYPLTLLIAPAGSGKTTALAGFAMNSGWPIAWCRMSADDTPLTLLMHVAAACRMVPSAQSAQMQARLDGLLADAANGVSPLQAIEQLVNVLLAVLDDDTLLILDDYHQADQHPELRAFIEHFLAIQPAQLHLLLSTRYEPELVSLATIRARGEICQLGQSDLAFTVEEAQSLFTLYDRLPPLDIADLTATCRGWPLALQALASELTTTLEGEIAHAEPHPTETALLAFHRLTPLLDSYLKQHVLQEQPPDLQTFLFTTANLRWLDPGICRMLSDQGIIRPLQEEVERRCLFLELTHQGHLAYQPLFKAFLERHSCQHFAQDTLRDLHHYAAEYYRVRGDQEGVIYHLLAIGESTQAAMALEEVARTWLMQGNTAALLTWLDRLPESERQRPLLLEALAAAYHRLGRFEQALQIYQQAEHAFQQQGDQEGHLRALRGRAEVYLDTVQPAPAVALLKQILKLLPRTHSVERAEILRLQAENWANRGRADIALILETTASRLAQEAPLGERSHVETLDPDPRLLPPRSAISISPRLLLRSGRLHESRQYLETLLGLDPQALPTQPVTTFVAHREPLLLLGFIYTMLGNGPRALALAHRGLIESQQSGSPLTEALAHMRVAHAYQVIAPLDTGAANQHYQAALALVQASGVARARAEAYMGLTLLQGYSGDLAAAEASARSGLEVAEAAGDEWIAALIWLALGGAGVSFGDRRALVWLDHANQRFTRGGDTYGQSIVALWRALWHLRASEDAQATEQITVLLNLVQHYGYEGLLTSLTLFGPRDMSMLVPVLLRGRAQTEHTAFAQQLLRQAFPSIASDDTVDDYHPGYTLRVQMLGTFRVWRGSHEIQAREWQREKARQLFQLLLTYRGRWLQREQICAWLWPDSDLDAAERQFKVTLNALNTALEPLRPPRTAPFFIRRQGLAYSFAPSYGCWIDVDEFELRTTGSFQADAEFAIRNSQIAVQLYKGDYLSESLYDSWTLEERERLLARYLATATALADRLSQQEHAEEAVHLCEQVLKRDRCYEEAYQILMRAYARTGRRSQALRSYTRCVQALQSDLGIEPLPETTELYERIKRNEKI